MADWFNTSEPQTLWLVHGLITSDDCAGAVGKPKSGKSTSLRALTAAVVKGGTFLGREVYLPSNTGRVLYLHLDRKDPLHQVARELKLHGITDENKDRVRLFTAVHLPKDGTNEDRLSWLVNEIAEFRPHLVIVDLLAHLIKTKKGINDYDSMMEAIAMLQDGLTEIHYAGAIIFSLHARKSESEDVTDNLLGTTGIRGSLSTGLYFKQYRKQKVYTIQTDQTFRDTALGELDETVVNRDSATGALTLGAKYEEIKHEAKKDEWEVRRQKVLGHITRNPGKTLDDIEKSLKMSLATILSLINALVEHNSVYSIGAGKKGDPKRYFPATVRVSKTNSPVSKSSEPQESEPPNSEPREPSNAELTVMLNTEKQALVHAKDYAEKYPKNPRWKTEVPRLEQVIEGLSAKLSVAKKEGLWN